MKRAAIFLLMTAIIMQAFSQEVISKEKEKKKTDPQNEKVNITLGDNLLSVQDDKDAFRIRIGNRGLEILESLEGKTKFNFEKYDTKDEESGTYAVENNGSDDKKPRNYKRFRGHWSGMEIGFNSLLTADRSFVMPSEIDYMTLHSGKSTCFNLNFSQQSFGLNRHIGVVTGLGLNWNNYHFDGNNNILKGSNGIITELDPQGILKKSKFTTLYLTVPLLFEFQIPTDNKQINLAGGLIGAIKLDSHSKMVYDNGDKVKSNADFSLNLRYGPTVRVGFENFNIYASWYNVPLFRSGKGPGGYELHPFEIGFSFSFND